MSSKTKKLALITLALALVLATFTVVVAGCNGSKEDPMMVVSEHKILGSGGYGAVFCAQIDPFDQNTFAAICDMGCVYFSHDAGKSWSRHNIKGTLFCLQFDPSTEGVVWMGGSGVFKSTDHGKTVKMVFPKEDQVTSADVNYENINNWIYTDGKSDYIPQYQIGSVCVNRKSGGKNVFVAQRVPASGFGKPAGLYIHQTTDGENFSFFARLDYDYNVKLDYDETNDCLIVVTSNKIVELNKNGEVVFTLNEKVHIHHQTGNTIPFDSCYDAQTGKNTFVFSIARQVGSLGDNSDYDNFAGTACYKTNNLRDTSSYVDLTKALVNESTDDLHVSLTDQNKGLKSFQYNEWIVGSGFVQHQFPWTIVAVSVVSDDVVYLSHDVVIPKTNGETRRTIAYVKYEKGGGSHPFTWVFGFPHKPVETEENRSWQDGDSGYCFGMSSSPQNSDALVFSTMVGIYYTPDGQKVYQCNSNVLDRKMTLTATRADGYSVEIPDVMRTTTTGVDVYCTHRVATDPFDKTHVVMACTDFGLLQSWGSGESWVRLLRE